MAQAVTNKLRRSHYFTACQLLGDDTCLGLASCHVIIQVKFNGSVWRQISPQAKDLMRQMLQPDAERRPSASDLLSHPWLAATAPTTAIPVAIVHQLQLFAGLSRARRVLLGVTANSITGSEASRLLKQFLAVDRDYSGTLDYEELASATKQVGKCLCTGQAVMTSIH